jgi:HNH endonuclease
MYDEQWFASFLTKFKRVGECLIWQYSTNKGYGQVNYKGATLTTHIVMYEQLVGSVPMGKELHHLCENKACGELIHLEPKTRREHMEEHGMVVATLRASQTHCSKGHLLPEPNAAGRRICLECANQRSLEWSRKNLERRREIRRESAFRRRKP